MKPCPECGDKDYRYYQGGNGNYFLGCTKCGYYAEDEQIRKLEDAEELIINGETERIEKTS